jgi:hypothetical protein
MKNDIERLLKLSGVQMNENGDYDFGHVEPRTHKVKSIASKPGQANLPVRMVNNQGDNPLDDSESDVPGDMEHDLTTEDASVDFDQDTETDTDDFQEPTDIEQGHTYTLEIKGQATPVMVEYDGNRFITFKVVASGEYFVVTRMEFEDMMIPDEIAEAPFDAHTEEEPQKGMYIDVRNEVWDDAEDFEPNLMSKNSKTQESFTIQYDTHVLDESTDLNAITDLGWSYANHIRAMNPKADLKQLKVVSEGTEVWNPIDGLLRESEVHSFVHTDITDDVIDALHKVLKRVGISDKMIENGDVRLTAQGYKKLAHQLTSEQMNDTDAEQFCQRAIHALAHSIDEYTNMNEEELDEFAGMGGNERFSYVTDTLGNVQISDAQTGADVYLQGQDAQEFLGAIEQTGDSEEAKQHVMSQYEHVMDNQKNLNGDDFDLFNR